MTAFISGHLDLTQEEFDEHYAPRILDAIQKGHNFIVGDARGADAMAQQFIHKHGQGCALTICFMFYSPRNTVEGANHRGGFDEDSERDRYMTLESDFDIAWVRLNRPKSGTQKNIDRRKKLNSKNSTV